MQFTLNHRNRRPETVMDPKWFGIALMAAFRDITKGFKVGFTIRFTLTSRWFV